MRILVVFQGEYGDRIATNLEKRGPADWLTARWQAPPFLPPVIDYPEDFLPDTLPDADLVLSLGEHPGVAELLPDIVKLCGARAVIAPVDNVAWLPPGLMNQLAGWLAQDGVEAVFPKPFCSLTERTYNSRRMVQEYDNSTIAQFARHFGRPEFRPCFEEGGGRISSVDVERDSPCGCAHYVAEGLGADLSERQLDDILEQAGLLHHHFPCLAGMVIDPDYKDTLMHISGAIVQEAVGEQVKPFVKQTPRLRPSGYQEQ